MNKENRDSHFNVNVRTNGGSRALMANNEDSFLRAMEIQERKREKKELEKEKNIETPTVQEEAKESADNHTEPTPTAQAETAPPATPAESPKPTGGNPAPQPQREFTAEERAAMLKRAKAHAAEVQARKK